MIRAIELNAMMMIATYGKSLGPGSRRFGGILIFCVKTRKKAQPKRPTIPVMVSLLGFFIFIS